MQNTNSISWKEHNNTLKFLEYASVIIIKNYYYIQDLYIEFRKLKLKD